MRLCKGAEYDWCGAPECAAKMKSDMFVPLNLRKSNDDDVDLRSIIEPERLRRAAAAKEELLSVKKFIAEKIAEAVECGKCVVQLIPKQAVLHNDPDAARITHFVEVIGKHEDEIVEWLARNDVRIETFRNNSSAAGYNVVWNS